MIMLLKIVFLLAASLLFAGLLAIALGLIEMVVARKLRERRRRKRIKRIAIKDPEFGWWEFWRRPRRGTDTLAWTLTERGRQLLAKEKRTR